MNGTPYDKSSYETHIVSHIWSFNLSYKSWLWMALKGHIKALRMLWLKFTINTHKKSYDLSVYIKIVERTSHLKVKLRSHQFKCKISMSNCPIAFKFGTEVQSQSKNIYLGWMWLIWSNLAQRCNLNRKISILGECGSYGQIMTIKLNLTK